MRNNKPKTLAIMVSAPMSRDMAYALSRLAQVQGVSRAELIRRMIDRQMQLLQSSSRLQQSHELTL